MEFDQPGQGFHGFDQRQGAGAVVKVAAGLVLGPGGDEQDADGRGDNGHIQVFGVRQAAANAHGLCPLKEEAFAIVEEFPREAQQFGGRLLRGLDIRLGGAGLQ